MRLEPENSWPTEEEEEEEVVEDGVDEDDEAEAVHSSAEFIVEVEPLLLLLELLDLPEPLLDRNRSMVNVRIAAGGPSI
ncbi:hypothetical protein PoB_005977600 [Plakobranchus ocellatus]|uniref:Uncharacterized protein n=1 Tax=Plakobranchus ocellatus TaxID=259542 RepID=A0AAV4CMU0_9GAST|nr:hypothetical protein PoB_005977600 [Plakobranchus ocellatus]